MWTIISCPICNATQLKKAVKLNSVKSDQKYNVDFEFYKAEYKWRWNMFFCIFAKADQKIKEYNDVESFPR